MPSDQNIILLHVSETRCNQTARDVSPAASVALFCRKAGFSDMPIRFAAMPTDKLQGKDHESIDRNLLPGYYLASRSVAQPGSAPGLGPGGPRFESLYSDHTSTGCR